MVIRVMRERMRPGLVMGDHPSIAGRSRVLGKKKHKSQGGQRASARSDQDPNRGGRVESSRTEYALGLTTRRVYSNG